MLTRTVVVVGAGPAGCAFALAMARKAPGLVGEMLLLEKAVHPREKPCGGGVTIIGERALRALGLTWDDLNVPSVPVHHLRFVYESRAFSWDVPYIFRVIRRPVFDAALAAQVRKRGVALWEQCPVQGMTYEGGWWYLDTPRGTVRARVVVGADGAKGVVRKALRLPNRRHVSRLVEVFMPPEDPLARETVHHHTAWFDFTPIHHHVQGYVWDFPAVEDGHPVVNRGVFDSRVWSHRPRANLADILHTMLRERGVSPNRVRVMGHPERWYDPRGVYSRPGALLIGEAAGIEPMLGEGISFALWYGVTVAPWVIEALERGDLSFADYNARLRFSELGRHLTLRVRLAQFAYARSPAFVRFWWTSLGRFLQVYKYKVLRDMGRENLGLPAAGDWP